MNEIQLVKAAPNAWETLTPEELIREVERAFARINPNEYWAPVRESLQKAAEASHRIRVKSFEAALRNPRVR